MVRMMIAQPQLPTREWIRLSSQKMGFGEDGQPAVVDGELQGRGDLFELVLELRAGEQTLVKVWVATGLDVTAEGEALPDDVAAPRRRHPWCRRSAGFVGRYPGGHEVVLDHRDPAVR
jgi:hypothetical protein